METPIYWLGIDFGATNLRAALVNLQDGSISCRQRASTPALDGPDAIIQQIAALISTVIRNSGLTSEKIAGVGIGCPAAMDMAAGNLVNAPNLPGDWPSVPFKARLEALSDLPVHPINDVRAITLGELTYGAGKGFDTVVCYAIGTGLGGGVAINGGIHLGISGSAGELGHMVVDPLGLPCNCGGRGCLETIVSGTAITAQAAHAVITRKKTLIADLVHGDVNRIDPAIILEAARRGDPVAVAIFENAGFYLGISITNILVTVCPRRILIGGGLAAAGELLLAPARKTVQERAHMVPLKEVQIVCTSLGDDAGLLGAAVWAEQQQRQTL